MHTTAAQAGPVVEALLAEVAGRAATFECDVPLSQLDAWPDEVRAAARRLLASKRSYDDQYAQTGVLSADNPDVWHAFARFAAFAYDATVWDADGVAIVELADEGQSVVARLDEEEVGRLRGQLDRDS